MPTAMFPYFSFPSLLLIRAGVEQNPGPVPLEECKSHNSRVHFWKNLWNTLKNSTIEENMSNPMWHQFKASRLTKDALRQTINKNAGHFSEAVVQKIELTGEIPENDNDFDEVFYMRLFQLTRNKGCQPLDETLSVTVTNCEGESQLTLPMLENEAVKDQRDVNMVPEHLFFQDHLGSGLTTEEVLRNMEETFNLDVSNFETDILSQPQNRKMTSKNVNDLAVQRAKENMSKNPAFETIKNRQAEISEENVAKAFIRYMKEGQKKGTVLRSIKTKEFLESSLEKFGFQFSIFPTQKSEEVEQDIITLCEPEGMGPYICGLVEVKRPTPDFPWSTAKPTVSKVLAAGGVAQLARDVCRVLEIIPDVDAMSVEFRLALALPDVEQDLICKDCLTGNPSVRLLSKNELKNNNEIHKFLSSNANFDSSVVDGKEIHKKLIGRYLGNQSLVPLRTKADMTKALTTEMEYAGCATDTALEATVNQIIPEENVQLETSIDSLINKNQDMAQIKEAMIKKGGFLKKLKKEKSNIPWDDIEVNMTGNGNKFLQRKGKKNENTK